MTRIIALILMACPVAAEGLTPAIARMQAAAAQDPLLATCPADLYRSRISLLGRLFGRGEDLPDGFCAVEPDACATLCLDGASGDACLNFGLVMETVEGGDELTGRHAHALACALGDPAGCTNRGGGIRNVPMQGDALSLLPFPDKQPCLFRSFDLACAAGDSWGCAMLGQAHEYGEGTPTDTKAAILAYRAACAIAAPDMDFPACVFAQAALDGLDARP